MSMPLQKWSVIVQPTDTPVSLALAKSQIRVDTTDDDALIGQYIAAATDYAQDSIGMSLMPQTLALSVNAEDVSISPPVAQYPGDPFTAMAGPLVNQIQAWGSYGRAPVVKLTRGPVVAISGITDAAGNTLATTTYRLERTPAGDRVRLLASLNYPVIVTYTTGYASAAAIPAGIRQAILCHVGSLYQQRASTSERPVGVVPHSLDAFYRLKSRVLPGG